MSTTHTAAPRVLVTGASIAGPALAWGLHKAGYAVTLLERSSQPREAGQNIDIRGLGREVLRRMNLEKAVRENLTGEEGTQFVDAEGRPYASFPRQEGQDGPTAELEILRGKFAEIMVALVPSEVDLRYGDFITAAGQDETGVEVTLQSGSQERYDLLLVAEGRSSRTRRLLFAEETEYRDRGVSITYGTLQRQGTDTDWWQWYTAPRSRVASIRPDNVGTMRASLSFASEPLGFESLPVASQLHILRERFRGAGWQSERILEGFAELPGEFYTQRMEQVVVSTWSKGRVALVGDAAWGSGPTGMGTTLALVGAHILAGELGKDVGADPTRAFTRYEKLLRTYADSAQGLPPGGARALHPSTPVAVSLLRVLHRVVSARPVRSLAQNTLLTSARDVPHLDDYALLRR